MKLRKIILMTLMVLSSASGYVKAQSGGEDFFRVKSALLAERKTFDFRLNISMLSTDQSFRVPINKIDTLTFLGPTTLSEMQWSLRYAMYDNWELGFTGISYLDQSAGTFRYGAGDTRVGIRYATPNDPAAENNIAVELYYSFPSGFDEGERIVRAFSSEGGSFGAAAYMDFNWNNWSAKINGGFYHAGGKVQKISDPRNTFWYNTLNGVYGIGPSGEIIQSSQFHIGVGLGKNFFFGTKIFGEYYSQNILVKEGSGKSLGNIAGGITIYKRPGIDIKLGGDMPLGEIRPNTGFFLDVRLNSIIGGRRRLLAPAPVNPLEELAFEPGVKPFIQSEGVLYSVQSTPVRDNIFVIDGTPSMLGRGVGGGPPGEEVLRGIIEFVQILIDSIPNGSNIALISYNNEVATLSWQNIDDSKKEEIKNSVRDIPDLMNVKADAIEANPAVLLRQELLEEAISQSYRQLETFKNTDYNKQHLQRVILFSDGIDESSFPHNIATGFDAIQRKYQLNRDDFRFFYYIHTNPNTEGARIDDNIIAFSEREDGKVKRSVDINNVDEVLIEELNFNGVAEQTTLAYLSQLSKMAILEFNTRNLGSFGDPLYNAFRSVFDNNVYFVLTPKSEIRAIMSSEGIRRNQKVVIRDMVKFGKRLGADYVVYGEVLSYNLTRGRGIHIPYLIGFPKTVAEIEVAIQLVNVSDGTLKYVDTISASASKGMGVMFFSGKRENKLAQLSGIELMELQKKLMLDWAKKLKESMFEDLDAIPGGN